MNNLMIEANELLKKGGFEYAFCGGQAIDLFLGYESRTHGDIDVCTFWNDRNRVIQYMQSHGFKVYEMLGGDRAHFISDVSEQYLIKRNIFCFTDRCPLVKTYPLDKDDCCVIEFFNIGQTKLDFIEFLFNEKTEDHFVYARCREIARDLQKAILASDGISYLAPELCLLYKSTDTERDGYGQDFKLAYNAMGPEQREWFENAMMHLYPDGHKWMNDEHQA